MEPLEIEVKFFLTDRKSIRNRIIALEPEQKGRVFESNIRYEDADNTLVEKRSLLRLRRDTNTTLTFKSDKSESQNDAQVFKVHRELEVTVSDFQIMDQILDSLGFHQEQIYEKWRETFVLGKTVLCLDTMPFGEFLEIEGDGDDIINVANTLGLVWDNRILNNYLSLFDAIRTRLKLSFNDITFKNFEQIKLNPVDFFVSGHA